MTTFTATVEVTAIATGITTRHENPVTLDCDGLEVFVPRLLTLLDTAQVNETDNGTRYQFVRNGCRIWFYAA